ncbi:MAG: hypothetical protein M3N68_08190 [Actinomycetota bacterium]|nr:hypothetical protein [Actinomycetota bacterium]
MRAPLASVLRRSTVAVLASLALVSSACGEEGGSEASREGDGEGKAAGHVALRFSGAVTGPLDAPLEVACFSPSEPGDAFTVSIDADAGLPIGLPVGTRRLAALDFSIPDYDGPKAYDLRRELDTEEGFDGDEFFLLFDEPEDDAFLWGDEGAAGTITVDQGGESGRLTLRGWKNSGGDRIDVEGTFRCGRKAER